MKLIAIEMKTFRCNVKVDKRVGCIGSNLNYSASVSVRTDNFPFLLCEVKNWYEVQK